MGRCSTVEIDIDKIVLLPEERRILRQISKRKVVTVENTHSFVVLYENGLITENLTKISSFTGCRVPDGTVSISDFGKRFLQKSRADLIHRYLTPVVVSVIANIIFCVAEAVIKRLL